MITFETCDLARRAHLVEHKSPLRTTGEREMLSFLIDRPRLFEAFVARWLKQHLPGDWQVQEQESLEIARSETGQSLSFRADAIIRQPGQAAPDWVLDTKYKQTSAVDAADVAQVVAYAVAYGCTRVALIYPEPPSMPQTVVGGVTVRFVAYDLTREIGEGGVALLAALL
jgi:5-methylcytosine-specific restriction endonuclease McrBC regulatory subunit McrC